MVAQDIARQFHAAIPARAKCFEPESAGSAAPGRGICCAAHSARRRNWGRMIMHPIQSWLRGAYRLVMMTLDETALINAAVCGDPDALSTLLGRHGPAIERSLQISSVWRSALEPADVMQVTYLEAFLQIRRFDPARGASFEAWLRRIAENNLR